MKTYSGSLQRRGKRYYLVVHRLGRQKWLALKTDKLNIARMRAARIAPADPDDEMSWLEQLVRTGEYARIKLARLRAKRVLRWDNLWEACARIADAGCSPDAQRTHAHWLDLLSAELKKIRPTIIPAEVTRSEARQAMTNLASANLSASRMLGYFRHVWRDLGLDAAVWPKKVPQVLRSKEREHYRRLSVDEIRTVHDRLVQTSPPLADMVLIGYATGLRLSDVAELELSEIEGPFLHVCPNKTRHTKPNPLKIPLTDEARAVVDRLQKAAQRSGSAYLFGQALRHRPSRRIAAAFRKCGVAKLGTGRASFHSLRATFISLMDEAGVPPHVTDAITGHCGGGMHARYSQPSAAALCASVTKAIPRLILDNVAKSGMTL